MTDHVSSTESQDTNFILSSQSLSKAVHDRYAEYTRPLKLKLKVGSWNTAAHLGTENDLASWFVQEDSQSRHTAKLSKENLNITEDKVISATESKLQLDKIKDLEASNGDDCLSEIEDQEEVGIYVLGLQEVTSLSTAREYIGRIYTDPEPISRWRKALVEALPSGYVEIMEQQLAGLLLFIYASPSIAPKINSVSTVTIGTGIIGYLGNKGAIVTRIILADTTRIVFVNSHLASGPEPQQLERRFWDIEQILQRTKFEPINSTECFTNNQDQIGDEEYTFWFGDLNFRLDGLPGDEIRRLLMIMSNEECRNGPQPQNLLDDDVKEDETFIIHGDSDDENDEETGYQHESKADDFKLANILSPNFQHLDAFAFDSSQDPASLQSTLNCLLPHDQLKNAQANNRILHDGWKEGPISFLPTYKYDIGAEMIFDSSEKKRAPSWCDRILYRSRRDKDQYEEKCKNDKAFATQKNGNFEITEKNDIKNHEESPYDYNPDEDGVDIKNNYDPRERYEGSDPMKKNQDKRIDLNIYTSHQRVTSSDHKPIHATFTLSYDVILHEVKAKIQQEVVRDLDRAENERRPEVTIIIDHSMDGLCKESPMGVTDAVDFGEVAYNQKIVRSLTIANTSRAPAMVYFLDRKGAKGNDSLDSSSWLSVYFSDLGAVDDESAAKLVKTNVTLEPGDAINATLEALVKGIELVRALNKYSLQLEEILVLRVCDGPDHFIPVRGSWLQTCLGRSINELLQIPDGGVRNFSLPKEDVKPLSSCQDSKFSAPRELYRLTEAIQSLIERVTADSNILESASLPQDAPGWPFDSRHWIFKNSTRRDNYLQLVIQALDTSQNLTEVFTPETLAIEKLEVISEALLLFLSYLSDGIITHNLWLSLEQAFADRGPSPEEIKAWTLDILSAEPNHNISFIFLTSMLAQVVAELASVSSNSNSSNSSYQLSSKRLSNVMAFDLVLRKSMSWKVKQTPPQTPVSSPPLSLPDPLPAKREQIVKAMTEIFVPVIFRAVEGITERQKRNIEEKRVTILQSFLAL
ncbi:putative phosphatase family protein [Erysiphe necator]|uniref:Putative phosphatase family protein n=1 Tax=Uncinula necator TaxID=52586 RepID=A0A0B1NZQ3_UNCNE|nr:putative phosphatase family protein [Erysiphe necator]